MSNLESVVKHLSLLSAEEIRALVGLSGIKGVPYGASSCPAAEFIRHQTGMEVLVYPLSCVVATFNPESSEYERVPTPDSLRKFVTNFDDGLYPELVDDDG